MAAIRQQNMDDAPAPVMMDTERMAYCAEPEVVEQLMPKWGYYQKGSMESFAPPRQEMMEGEHRADEGEKATGEVDVLDLVPCAAGCCWINSLYCEFPSCIGCSFNDTICCVEATGVCCKMQDCSDDRGTCCICWSGDERIIKPTTCCKGQQQFFCFDQRGAFPCDSDVPCICTLLPFCTCFADMGMKVLCCSKIEKIVPRLKEAQDKAKGAGQVVGQPQVIIMQQQPQMVIVQQ